LISVKANRNIRKDAINLEAQQAVWVQVFRITRSYCLPAATLFMIGSRQIFWDRHALMLIKHQRQIELERYYGRGQGRCG
jgi:hypothetical protein